MKKLMIVAAVATMAGALVAADGYDFTASVKTTKGKAGSQKTTFTVNMGRDANLVYWWDDLNFDNEKEAKTWFKQNVKTNKDKELFAASVGFDEATGECDYNVPEYYKGRVQWCYTFKYTRTDTDCYRVAGSRKIKGIVYIDGCCDDTGAATTWEYVAGDDVVFADADGNWDGYITPGILFRFGGVSLAKSTKVEFAGVAGNTSFDGNADGMSGVNTFALAGQGAYDDKNGYLKNISGNIVGVLANPDCESCCDYNRAAAFYACDGFHSDSDDWQTITGTEGTAAFGTWSIKYNKRY